MGISWQQEAADERPDPVTGARISRLTSAPCINNNIYCEQPYGSPDGRRIAWVRVHTDPAATHQIYVADLDSMRITRIAGVTSGNNASWGDEFLYEGPGGSVMSFSLSTLQHRVVLSQPPVDRVQLGSVSPDNRYVIYTRPLPGPTLGLEILDLQEGSVRTLLEHPEITNPHLQFNPVHGRQIMVQHNVGSELNRDGSAKWESMGRGCTLFVVDVADGAVTPLPVGEPYTMRGTGHEAFVADTGRVCFTVHWDWETLALDARYPTGNLFTAAPGDAAPTVFEAPEHRFNHVCVSRCGRYFLADSYGQGLPGPVPLVVGNLETGKYRSLIQDCQASCGAAQFTHPHAYFTADTRRVIYNADPHGIPHLHMATIPDGFLASLD